MLVVSVYLSLTMDKGVPCRLSRYFIGIAWLQVSGALGERLDCGPINTAIVLGWNIELLFVWNAIALAFSL